MIVVGLPLAVLLLDLLLVEGAVTGTIIGAMLAPSTPATLFLIVLIPVTLFCYLALFKSVAQYPTQRKR